MSIKYTTIPQKILKQSILSTDMAFILNNIEGWGQVDLSASDFGTQAYGVFMNADKSKIEIFEWDPSTIADASIDMVRRGLKFDGDLTTEVSNNKLDWTANETYVLLGTDTPQLYEWLKAYVDAAIINSGVPATDIVPGIIIEATQAQVDAGTKQETYNGQDYDLTITPDKVRAKKYHDYVADEGSTDDYVITVVPAITAYSTGQEFTFKANTANTGACTLNVCGLGTKTIKKDVSSDLITGDILVGQIIKVMYDGTNFQLLSRVQAVSPIVRTYTASANIGSYTTRFDITNPSGTTFRYTWDGTGTDPTINTTTFPTGALVDIRSASFNSNNNGFFIITGSGTNYFEITNASGVAENDKILGSGSSSSTSHQGYLAVSNQTWTKPTGLKYIVVEVQGAGGGSADQYVSGTTSGSGAGGYAKKLFEASSLSSSYKLLVGYRGKKYTSNDDFATNAGASYFNGVIGYGGLSVQRGGDQKYATGGSATGGDINIPGQCGSNSSPYFGGSSVLGHGNPYLVDSTGYGSGGYGSTWDNDSQSSGCDGIIIITEYYY